MLPQLVEYFENFPVEEIMQTCAMYIIHFIAHHHKTTELENLGEFSTHGVLEVLGFCLCHLATGKVKHFFTTLEEKRSGLQRQLN